MVLSTLHTRDAPSALSRLTDMGIEPFLVSSAVDCIVAQRLVRKLCESCKRPLKVSKAVLAEHDLEGRRPLEPDGCPRCGGSGYRGRGRHLRSDGDHGRTARWSSSTLRWTTSWPWPSPEGMRRLRDDGLLKVRAGLTSIAEIERITSSLL